MTPALPSSTALLSSLAWALAALVIGFVSVVVIPPGAILFTALLIIYDVAAWRRRDPRLRRAIATTCAYVVPVAVYFVSAALH